MTKTLKFFNQHKKYSKEFIQILDNKFIRKKYDTFLEWAEKEETSFNDKNFQIILNQLHKSIKTQLNYFIHLDYYIQNKSGEWCEAGADQIKNSLFRVLLKKKANEDLSYEELMAYENTIQTSLTDLKISQLTLAEAKIKYENFKFKLPWGTLVQEPGDYIPELLKFLGSKYTLVFHYKKDGWYAIFGEYKRFKPGKQEVLIITKEVLRTGQYTVPLAAMNYKDGIIARRESIETLFHQKWAQVSFDDADFMSFNPYWALSRAIQRKALSYYGIQNQNEILAQKDKIIVDVRDNIIYHELGHESLYNEILSYEELGVLVGPTYYKGDDIYDALLEFLADYCPEHGKNHGCFDHMIKVSKKDPKRAERLFYIYFSDVWFYDTADDYMLTYSDIVVMMMLRYVKLDQSVDFKLMEKEILYHENLNATANLSMFDRFILILKEEVASLIKITRSATYTFDKEDCDFYGMKSIIMEAVVTKKHKNYIEDTKLGKSILWYYYYLYVDKASNHKEKMITYIDNQKKVLLDKVMIMACGEDVAKSYNFNHRQYIVDRMKALGFASSTQEVIDP